MPSAWIDAADCQLVDAPGVLPDRQSSLAAYDCWATAIRGRQMTAQLDEPPRVWLKVSPDTPPVPPPSFSPT